MWAAGFLSDAQSTAASGPDADADGGTEPAPPDFAIIGGIAFSAIVCIVLSIIVCRKRSPGSSAIAFGDRVRVGDRCGVVCDGPDEDGIYRMVYDDDDTISDFLYATEFAKTGEDRSPSDLSRASQFHERISAVPKKTVSELEMTLALEGPRRSFSAKNLMPRVIDPDPFMPSHWGTNLVPMMKCYSVAENGMTPSSSGSSGMEPAEIYAAAAMKPAPSALAGSRRLRASGAVEDARNMHVKFRLMRLNSFWQPEIVEEEEEEEEEEEG